MHRLLCFAALLAMTLTAPLLADAFTLPVDKSKWVLPRWATNVSVVNEGAGGRSCFKIVTPKRDWSQQIRLPLFYETDVARVVFTGVMKTQNVTGGAAAIEKARAQLCFLDNNGDRVGNWPGTTDRDGTTDWQPFDQDHKCPPGTRVIEVWLGMYLSTGTAWFDDVKVTAYDSAGNEIQPIKRAAVDVTDTTGWLTFEPGTEDTSRPLVVDFAPFLPAPAGKLGFVSAKDGQFVYDNGDRAKFWGIGYIKDWCPPKEQAPIVAERLARAGINLVRFHGMDAQAREKSIFDPKSDKTDTLDPDKMDRLDFLVAELKKRGIYSNLNLLTKRRYLAGDGVADADKLPQGGKAASMFNRRLIELQKDYARLLLTHVNPYTGIAYKDEPAVAMLEIVNESSLNMLEFLGGTPPVYESELNDLFTAWCRKQNVERPETHVKLLIKKKDGFAERFIEDVTRDYFTEMNAYVKDELKVRQPISGTQFDFTIGEKRAQADLDYIDHHGYHDHPAGGWDPMSIYTNKPMVKITGGSLIDGLVTARVAGRPYTVSEWNNAWPNDYITEGPLLVAAYAGFNDWDSAMVFGTDGLAWEPAMSDTFGHASKPHFMAPLMTSAMLFYRGDVAPGPVCAVDARKIKPQVKPGELFSREEALTMRCMIVTRPDRKLDAKPFEPKQPSTTQPSVYASSDGQIAWKPTGQFVLDTPRAQAVLGFTGGESIKTSDTSVTISNPFGQVIVNSLTDAPIKTSNRLLITATARAENTGQTFRPFRKGLSSLGTGPIMVEPVKAAVTIRRDVKPTVYVVDWFGRRTAKTQAVDAAAPGEWIVRLGDRPEAWYEVVFGSSK